MLNSDIPEYASGNRFNHERKRPRKLLLHKRQINVLIGAIQRHGRTVVPLEVYFNEKGRAKVEIALATGKQAHDKRQSIKDRDWKRQRARLLARR
jgi:SsrA-binding protein